MCALAHAMRRTLLVTLLACFMVDVESGEAPETPEPHVPPVAKRLHHHLMSSYEKLIKPSVGPSQQLTVKMGMRLSQVLDVDEKNQIITISVWLRQEWYDLRLKWDPEEYQGVDILYIPSDQLWKPDIVLYNNADGDFVITLDKKATVFQDGRILWEPPAIYKSYCPIDMEFFPFDMQECFMKFGTWSYNGNEVDLQHVCNGTVTGEEIVIQRGIDLKDYYQNVEWDIINVTARRKVKFYPCCPEPYPDITFNITLRRRTLFYTLNLIMPCVSISCLSVLVFYLPSDSGEKITLSISILLALNFFFLLLSDMNPPTSLVIPLIGKYLLFIMVVVTASIVVTVYTIHINLNSPTTHTMSPWVRRVFTQILPKALLIKRPELDRKSQVTAVRTMTGTEVRRTSTQGEWSEMELPDDPQEQHLMSTTYPPEVLEALKGVRYIASQFKEGDDEVAEKRDWGYIAMVMDRLFLYIFATTYVCGTLVIFLYAPSLYDPREHMTGVDPNSTCQY
ncbi:acetylcholine receptor subunit alpha-like [Babylonia areolata]|uniref:acetylcholine receptor subunit alpha-like n=1 Tax=Babylonia areolata TaxID=304850 RepID=UPI003FD17BD4